MPRTKRLVSWGAIALLAALVATSVVHLQAAPPLSGAIFTTLPDGSVVNANVQYTSKCDVYLDGGPPPNAPVGAAGLPEGDYYFQVTDPSGKKLLSTDPVKNRRIHVNAVGVISAYTGTGGPVHPTGTDIDHAADGAITVQLANITCPADFLDTPNNGGVYKAWVTPVGDGTINGGGFVGDPTVVDPGYSPGYFHGFIPARSKTDNFKVKAKEATFCLVVEKEVLDNKGVPTTVEGWPFSVTDPLGVTNTYATGTSKSPTTICALTGGTYTVTEGLLTGYVNVGLIVNGAAQSPSTTYSFNWSPGKPDPEIIVFQNQLK